MYLFFLLGSGLVVWLIVRLFTSLVRRFPDALWVRLLWSRHGPRLDASGLTRGACLRVAGGFGMIVLAGVATLRGLDAADRRLGWGGVDNEYLQVLRVACFLVMMIAAVATLFLLVQAPFRPRAVPPSDA